MSEQRQTCPECGNDHLATYEHMFGWAETGDGVSVDEDGNIHADHDGYTDVIWDTQVSIGFGCDRCGWVNTQHTLIETGNHERSILLVVPGKGDEPIVVTFDLNEMDEPQTFTIDPDRGVVIPTELLPEVAS